MSDISAPSASLDAVSAGNHENTFVQFVASESSWFLPQRSVSGHIATRGHQSQLRSGGSAGVGVLASIPSGEAAFCVRLVHKSRCQTRLPDFRSSNMAFCECDVRYALSSSSPGKLPPGARQRGGGACEWRLLLSPNYSDTSGCSRTNVRGCYLCASASLRVHTGAGGMNRN